MKKVNFDDYQENYNDLIRDKTRFFDKDDRYFAEYKIRTIGKYLHRIPNAILEYGCGVGRNLAFLQQQFPEAAIYGCDISQKCLEAAAQELPSATLFRPGERKNTDTFDLVFVANVFHHIPPHERPGAIREIEVMMKPGASLFIFEHNPYNPVTRHLVNTCPFDDDAVLLKPCELKSLLLEAGFQTTKLKYALFFPAHLRFLRWLEGILAYVPMGGQYFIHARKPERT